MAQRLSWTSNLPAGATFDQYANSTATSESSWFNYTFPTSAFNRGTNTLAVEIHQGSGSSSDTRMDLVVRGEVSPGGGANVSDPLFFDSPTLLASRSYNRGSGESFALNSAFFSIDTVPADASNLVISEIHYRPENPSDPSELAVSGDRDDYEFLELENIGDQALDLSGVRFSAGIGYTFPPQSLLEVGGRIILVRDTDAFAVRYPGVAPFAEFDGRLSNDGEALQLIDASGADLRNFVYNDQLPWPTAPDGDGFSLVLVAPQTNPDHAQAASWRPSADPGGSPGESDATTFSGDPESLLSYALGSSEGAPVAGFIELGNLRYPAFTFRRNHSADDAILAVEYSSDMLVWKTDAVLEAAPHGEETWRTPVGLPDRLFWRVQVSLRE